MALTQKEAQYRYDCIEQGSILYNFHLNLYPTYYTGLTEVQFNLNKQCDKLFIDCSSKKVKKLIINGTLVEAYRHEDTHLYLDSKYLLIGPNILFVLYSNVYNNDQRGLMSFVDVDEKQYLYTTFQPYFANRVFPVFDQPDLKAPMNLSVTCPLSWTRVLSNQHHQINQEFQQKKYLQLTPTFDKALLSEFLKECPQKQSRMAIFPSTKIIPTYIYCIILGPFQEIELKQRYNNIPMSFYCSSTYLPYVQKMAPYLFQTTVQSMRFFQKFFGVPYNFSKYDQVFVNEMQMCAMQNCGMVTYHDAEYIWKDQVTLDKALDLADTMVHQLAHHWFGNLTTMKWWDDLWLKESFAQFIAYYALEVIQNNFKVVKYQSSMAQFLNRKSQRGYVCDKSLITHPIRGIVENTTVASSIFDGITYIKGASTLKQLLYLVGEQNFSAALKIYFTKYAFKNATLNDFIDCLQEKFDNQYGLTLHEWKKVWLQQCSLNQLEPVWWGSHPQSQGQNQKLLTIYQRPYTQKYPLLRPHKIKIALFKQDCSYDVLQVFIPAKQKISIPIDPTLATLYKAVLLNYEDHAFAKIIIDPISQEFFIKNILKINDILTRTHVWRNFYDMVMDADIPSTKYIELFVANIGQETSDTILQRNYQNVMNSIRLYTPVKYREQLYTRLFYFTLNLLQKANLNDSNRLITLRDNLCKLANSELAVRLLYRWYEGKYAPLQPHKLSSLNKWQIVFKVLSLRNIQAKQKLQILERQQKQDNSQASNLWKLKCSAVLCSDEQFDQYYLSLVDPDNSMSIYTKKYLMEGLNSVYNQERVANYKDKYYENIQKCASTLQSEHLRVFMLYMQPYEQNLTNIIIRLQKINLEGAKLQKVKFKMTKKIDFLQKQMKGQQTFLKSL